MAKLSLICLFKVRFLFEQHCHHMEVTEVIILVGLNVYFNIYYIISCGVFAYKLHLR